ncbi:protein-tyrosine phosphatase-like protein [Amanita rubescens]|nr:protein-tyrosine phosphatase-like protein [Amanita rubescens]
MNSAISAVPDWLSAAKSFPYLFSVLKILAEREATRDHARSLARQVLANKRVPAKSDGLASHYSVCVGCSSENAPRNRYIQLEPYDRTRVIASAQGLESRYLNANWVLERFGHKWWISTQAPLPNTVYTFLSLIVYPSASSAPEFTIQTDPQIRLPFQSRVRTVVQLTRNFESGRRKAHAYFPSEVGKSDVITPEEGCTTPAFKVTLLESRSFPEARCIQSTVSVTLVDGQGGETKTGRVPGVISFAQLVDSVNKDTTYVSETEGSINPDPPIIVHSLPLSSLLRSFGRLPATSFPTPISSLPPSPLGPLPASLANDLIAQEVDSLREQRPRMVERDEQVLFIYETLTAVLSKS